VRNGFLEVFPKISVFLIAYKNFCMLVFINFTCFLYIDTIDVSLGAKHFKAPAAQNSYFKQMHIGANKFSEIMMVNIKIMLPFVDTPSNLSGVKKRSSRDSRVVSLSRFQVLVEL